MDDSPNHLERDVQYAVWWCEDTPASIADAFERAASWLRRQHAKDGINSVVSISYDSDPEYDDDAELTGRDVGAVFLVYIPTPDVEDIIARADEKT